jgi:hypothetical protein
MRCPAAGDNLSGNNIRIGKAQPEDAPWEELAIAVDKLNRQLRFAQPTHTCGCCCPSLPG